MLKTIALLILFTIPAIESSIHAQNQNSAAGDLQALTDLYNSTNGASWENNTGWLNGNPSNDWFGIQVDASGRVTRIDLMENNLVEHLPESLGNLKKVEFLNVKANFLTGQLPASIGNMESLRWLYLAGATYMPHPTSTTTDHHPGKRSPETNTFTGSVFPPEWGQLPNIEHIELSQTEVSGPLPPEWGNMKTLRMLWINGSRIKSDYPGGNLSGNLPPEWGNLSNLTNLTLSNNPNLIGVLPPEWAGMVSMGNLRISHITLQGEFPKAIESWSNLRLLTADPGYGTGNGFTGEIPAFLLDDRTPLLNTLILTNNKFDAIENVDPANVTKQFVSVLSLNYNNIKGKDGKPAPFPEYVKVFRRMKLFSINGGGNEFEGSIPDDFFSNEFGTWSQLRGFNVSGQKIGGTLPTSFGESFSSASTQTINFGSAGFRGNIPDTWGEYQTDGIHSLILSGNELNGPIPIGLANWNWVYEKNGLLIQSNKFTYSDIIPLLEVWPANIKIEYHDQKPFPTGISVLNVSSGQSVELNLSRFHISDNTYQWYRNGQPLTNGENISGVNSHTLDISNIFDSDAGEYSLHIINPNAPQLSESVSQPINLKIGDATGALEAPGLLLPKSNTGDDTGSIQLQWTPVDGAGMYRVQTATANTFPDNSIVTYDEIADNNLLLHDMEYETTYYYRVMAYNDSQQSPWSATGDFTTGSAALIEELAAPELLAADYYPEDDPDAVHLNWEPVDDATYYPVEISTFQSFPADGTSVFEDNSETTLFIEGLDYETTYYYRVRARNESKQSPWSITAQFTIISEPVYTFSAPEILEPELNVDGKANSIQLNWTPVEGSLTYNLQVATKDQFQPRFTTDIDGVETTSVLLENLKFDTTYYYRIKALDETSQSSWSDIAQFTTSADPAVQLTSPSVVKKKEKPGNGNNNDNTVELEWEEVEIADDYQLQMSTEEEFPDGATMTYNQLEDNTHTVEDLEFETTYYYRVRARKGRAYSPWSQVSSTATGQDHDRSGIDPLSGIPLDFSLDQNYPNPFNPTTQIRYSIPEAAFVTIDILNIQGQRIQQLVSSIQDAGIYTVPFDARSLASGVYLYQISAGTFRHVKKMTLIR